MNHKGHEPSRFQHLICNMEVVYNQLSLRTILVVVLVLVSVSAAAQDSQMRVYRPNTADEDRTFLKNSPKTDFWDPVKYIPLGEDRSLTLSGEFRFRPEGFRIR